MFAFQRQAQMAAAQAYPQQPQAFVRDELLEDEDFEIVNGRRLLKQGRTMRVPMTLCDSLQRIVYEHKLRSGMLTDAERRQSVEEARREGMERTSQLWRNPPSVQPHVVPVHATTPHQLNDYPQVLGDAAWARLEAKRVYDEETARKANAWKY